MRIRTQKSPAQQQTGTGCSTLFFLVFAVFGGFFMVFMGKSMLKGRQVANEWPRVPATITSSEIITSYDSDGNTYRPQFNYTYEYMGGRYSSTGYGVSNISSSHGWADGIIDEHPVGSEAMVYVNPDNPSEAYIRAGLGMMALFMLIPIVFVVIGVGGAIWSFRNRNIITEGGTVQIPAHAARKTVTFGRGRAFGCFPEVGPPKPGRRLAVSLPLVTGHGAALFGLAFISIFWNGLSWTMFFFVYHEEGMSFPTVFIGLFCLIGIFLVGGFVHKFLRITMTVATAVEVDREPLAPGREVRMVLRQEGNNTINKLSAILRCREIVTYRVGTSTHTHEEVVYEYPLVEVENERSTSAVPLELQAEFALPADAMHSFKASSNEVRWSIDVKIDIPGKPDVDDKFHLRVAPSLVTAHG